MYQVNGNNGNTGSIDYLSVDRLMAPEYKDHHFRLKLLDIDKRVHEVAVSTLDPHKDYSALGKALNAISEYFFGKKIVKINIKDAPPLYIKIDSLKEIITEEGIKELEKGEVSVLHTNRGKLKEKYTQEVEKLKTLAEEKGVDLYLGHMLTPVLFDELGSGILETMKELVPILVEAKGKVKLEGERKLQLQNKQILKLEKNKKAKRAHLNRIKSSIEKKQKEKDALESLLKLSQDEILKVQQDKAEVESSLQLLQAKILEEQGKKQEVSSSLQSLQAQILKERKGKELVSSSLQSLQAEIVEIRGEKQKVNSSLQLLQAEILQVKEEKSGKESSLGLLEVDIVKAEENKKFNIEFIKSKKNTLKEGVEELENKRLRLEKEKEEIESKIKNLKDSNEKHTLKAGGDIKEGSVTHHLIKIQSKQVEQMRKTIEGFDVELSRLTKSLNENKKEKEIKDGELSSLESQEQEIENHLDGLKKQEKTVKESVKFLDEQIKESETVEDLEKVKEQEIGARLDALQEEERKVIESVKSLDAQIKESEKVEDLEKVKEQEIGASLDALKQQEQKVAESVKSLDEKLEKSAAGVQYLIQDKEKEIKNKKAHLTQLERAEARLDGFVVSLGERIEQLKKSAIESEALIKAQEKEIFEKLKSNPKYSVILTKFEQIEEQQAKEKEAALFREYTLSGLPSLDESSKGHLRLLRTEVSSDDLLKEISGKTQGQREMMLKTFLAIGAELARRDVVEEKLEVQEESQDVVEEESKVKDHYDFEIKDDGITINVLIEGNEESVDPIKLTLKKLVKDD